MGLIHRIEAKLFEVRKHEIRLPDGRREVPLCRPGRAPQLQRGDKSTVPCGFASFFVALDSPALPYLIEAVSPSRSAISCALVSRAWFSTSLRI